MANSNLWNVSRMSLGPKNDIEINFERKYNAQIDLSDKKRYIQQAFDPWQSKDQERYINPIEPVMKIELGKSDYIKFMQHYSHYMEIVEALDDPIVRDMRDKLLMYIRLKK